MNMHSTKERLRIAGIMSDRVAMIDDWHIFKNDDDARIDRRKNHYFGINDKTGIEIELDLSPYADFSADHFQTLISLGFPDRNSIGSMSPLGPCEIRAMQYGMDFREE